MQMKHWKEALLVGAGFLFVHFEIWRLFDWLLLLGCILFYRQQRKKASAFEVSVRQLIEWRSSEKTLLTFLVILTILFLIGFFSKTLNMTTQHFALSAITLILFIKSLYMLNEIHDYKENPDLVR